MLRKIFQGYLNVLLLFLIYLQNFFFQNVITLCFNLFIKNLTLNKTFPCLRCDDLEGYFFGLLQFFISSFDLIWDGWGYFFPEIAEFLNNGKIIFL